MLLRLTAPDLQTELIDQLLGSFHRIVVISELPENPGMMT
jgi:hypothetical protein